MFRRIVPFLVFLVFGLAAYGSTAQHRAKAHKKPAPVVQPQVEPAPAPQPPPPPPTPEQGPASPPEVKFQGGQLTITARNSTMSDVLNAVKQKTGAAVDMPTVTSERVVGQFGPGSPRDVMAQLLNGSHYDYVLLGSPADPGALKKVVLTARASGPEPTPAPSQPQVMNQPMQAVPEVETDQSNEEPPPQEFPQPEMQQAPEEEAQPDQGQPGQPIPGQPVVKTPEQLLRELQQQQQQQQQNGQAPQQQ